MANPSVLDQLDHSNFSLPGNNLDDTPNQSNWGYPDSTGDLNPVASRLQYTYSVDGDPNVRIQDYNRKAFNGATTVKVPSTLDELDPIAPNFTAFGPPVPSTLYGNRGPVVTQFYKSPTLQQYRSKGPVSGRY